MSDLFTQPMTIAALVLPLLVAFLIYFKSGADRFWWVGLLFGAFAFWGFIVLANQYFEEDITKAARAVIGEADEVEARSQFKTNFLKSYGFALGLALTGFYFVVLRFVRKFGRKLSH